jgi:hypothetical protein
MRLLFLCLARDCEATLPLFFRYLQDLESAGFSCSALVGEDSSRDRSREVIEAAGEHVYRVDTFAMVNAGSRLARMAVGRQILLDEATKGEVAADFICVMDLDNVALHPPDPASVRAALDRLEPDPVLFAIGATSYPVYYDLLSLRCEGHDYTTLNADLAAAQASPLTYHRFHKLRIYANHRAMTQNHEIPCESSFNGFCLYKAKSYLRGTYRAADEAEVCEHVTLNLSVGRSTGSHMLISPMLRLQTPADHAEVGFIRFWMDRFAKAWRKFRQ